MSLDIIAYNMQVMNKMFELGRGVDDPASDPDDQRQRWSDLTDEQKIDEAVDYMREYTVRNGAARASLLWEEALSQTKTTKEMINYIGAVMVRAKSESWTS